MHRFQTVISRPVKVLWAGWETDTVRLQQAGWQLSAEEQVAEETLRIAMRHNDLQLYGVTAPVNLNYFPGDFGRDLDYRYKTIPPLMVQYMSNKIVVNVMDNFSNFSPIDAYPQVATIEAKNIEDFKIFATPLVRTEEIIVEPQTVDTLMKQILEMQAPNQMEIRDRNRKREYREGEEIPRQNFHAQILSFAR